LTFREGEKLTYTKAGELQKKSYDRDEEEESIDNLRIRRIQTIINELLMRHVSVGSGRILDVGCGNGALIAPFCKSNKCYGVDVAERLIRRAIDKGVEGFVLDIDLSDFPFEDNFFDIAICAQVIEHLIKTDHALSEINRVLKLGRLLILSFPNVNQPASWLLQLFLDYPPIFSARYKSPHVRDFTLRIAKIALVNNGFKIISAEGTTIFPFKNRLARALAHRFPRLRERIILVAKKISNFT